MTGDGSIGDYQGGGGDASFGDAHSSSVAADLGFDIGTRGTSTAPDSIDVEQGQTLQGALAQALFDRLSQIDYTTPAGMAQGRFGLDSMSNLGLGRTEGLNPNNPTQSVDELIASNNVSNFLDKYAPTIMGALTGFGPQMSAVQALQRLSSGQTTPGQALTGLAAGLIGAKTGIPSGILEGIFQNDPGRVAGAGAQAGLGALVNSLTDNPLARVMADATLGSSLNRNVSESVRSSSKKGEGLPEILDSGLGNLSKLFSGTGTPSQRSASTGNTYSDAGNNPDTYAVIAAIEKAAQEYKPPTQQRKLVAGRYGPVMDYDFGA